MRWTVHIEGGPRRVNHAAVCIDGKIYSFGGYCSTEEYKDWDPIPVHVLDTATLRWSPVDYVKSQLVHFQRYGHTTVAHGHKVYMWGGRNNAVAYETLSCFDTETLSWSTPTVTGMVPFAKDGHSACIIKDKMYIFGGFEYVTDKYSQEVHCLDLNTMKWSLVEATGTAPSPRDFHTAVAVGDRMYIFGGRSDLDNMFNHSEEDYCQLMYYLDTVEEKWYELGPTGAWPKGRRSHSAWIYNDYMYIFGGYNGELKTHYNDLYRYSFQKNHWEEIEALGTGPCKRRRQACILNKDKLYLFAGTSPSSQMLRHSVEDDGENTEKLIDNDDLHVLDFSPSLKTLSLLEVIKNKLDYSWLPRELILDLKIMTIPNHISRPITKAG